MDDNDDIGAHEHRAIAAIASMEIGNYKGSRVDACAAAYDACSGIVTHPDASPRAVALAMSGIAEAVDIGDLAIVDDSVVRKWSLYALAAIALAATSPHADKFEHRIALECLECLEFDHLHRLRNSEDDLLRVCCIAIARAVAPLVTRHDQTGAELVRWAERQVGRR